MTDTALIIEHRDVASLKMQRIRRPKGSASKWDGRHVASPAGEARPIHTTENHASSETAVVISNARRINSHDGMN